MCVLQYSATVTDTSMLDDLMGRLLTSYVGKLMYLIVLVLLMSDADPFAHGLILPSIHCNLYQLAAGRSFAHMLTHRHNGNRDAASGTMMPHPVVLGHMP